MTNLQSIRNPQSAIRNVAILVLAASIAAAQETQTERDGPNAARDAVVARVKELMDKEVLALADDIATHPEIGFDPRCSSTSQPTPPIARR
jgi:hypothetical protein